MLFRSLFFNKQEVLEALRDVARGEEMTIDYDLSFGDEHVFGDEELAADDEPPHDRA